MKKNKLESKTLRSYFEPLGAGETRGPRIDLGAVREMTRGVFHFLTKQYNAALDTK